MPPPRRPKKLCSSSLVISERAPGAEENLLDHHGVFRQHRADRFEERERRHRRLAGKRTGLGAERLAVFFVRLGDGLQPRRGGALGARGHARADCRGNLGQRRLGVAEDCDLRRIVLADLPRIGVEMDERQARRPRIDGRRQRPGEQIAADGEQHIVLVEHLAHAGLRARHRTAIERMRRRERGAVRNEFDIDRRSDRFGERNKLPVRAALHHGVASDDERPLRLGEQLGGGGDCLGVAAHARRDARRFEQVDVGVVLQEVAGQ